MKTKLDDLVIKDLIERLSVFGLTRNQAKVFIAVVEAGSISMGKISEITGLYRQDIYKIVPKLQLKGLVTRSLGNPFLVKANPVREGLKALVLAQKATFEKIMSCMDASLDEIWNVMNMLYETEASPSLEEDEYCLLTSQKEIANRTDLLFSNAKTECNVVLNKDLLTREQNYLERFQNAVNNGATIQLIVETPRKNEQIAFLVEMVRPKNGSFSAKTMVTKMSLPFMLIDGRTVWISTSKMLNVSGRALPCVLWSNGKNIVSTYQERFERLWKSMKAAPLAHFPIASAKEHNK